MRLRRLLFVMAMVCACCAVWSTQAALAQEEAPRKERWVKFEPLRPPYTIMRIVKVMGAIQTGAIYSSKQMNITYDFRTHVNDGLTGCGDAIADGSKAWFVTTLDNKAHEVTFSRNESGALTATPDHIMVGAYELRFKWGCFRDQVFLANIKGESSAGPEACRTPIPYAYCDLNGLIFWQLPDWDGDVAPTPTRESTGQQAEEAAAAVQEPEAGPSDQ